MLLQSSLLHIINPVLHKFSLINTSIITLLLQYFYYVLLHHDPYYTIIINFIIITHY
jgi:hypothetical protein